MKSFCLMSGDSCNSNTFSNARIGRYQNRKLDMLKLFRDSLERRLSAMNASISTLEEQIKRDNSDIES